MPASPQRKLTLAGRNLLAHLESRYAPFREGRRAQLHDLGGLVRRRVRRFGLIADLQAQ